MSLYNFALGDLSSTSYATCNYCGARLDTARYGPMTMACRNCESGEQPREEEMAKIGDVFPSKYLNHADLNGRRITLTIDRVTFEVIGQPPENKAVVYFKGKDKGLALNKTNANSIHFITGSDDTDDWVNERIVVFPSQTEYQGKRVGCIRIDPPAAPGGPISVPQPPIPQPPTRAEVAAEISDDDVPF